MYSVGKKQVYDKLEQFNTKINEDVEKWKQVPSELLTVLIIY